MVSLICGTQGIAGSSVGEGREKRKGGIAVREMNDERLWTTGNKLRVLGRGGGGDGLPW